MKPLISIFLMVFLITIPRVIISVLWDSILLQTITTWLSFYLVTLLISFILVKEQEKYLK